MRPLPVKQYKRMPRTVVGSMSRSHTCSEEYVTPGPCASYSVRSTTLNSCADWSDVKPQLLLLESNYCIGGSRGGVRDARPPLGVQILSISCSFRENLACSRPPWRVHAPPPRENPGSATVLNYLTVSYTCSSTSTCL